MAERPKLTPEQWWSTDIIDMSPGVIRFRGYAIEDLIGQVNFAQMIWLLTRGELPDPRAAKLLEAALVSAVDHGPQAPSIAIARMAMASASTTPWRQPPMCWATCTAAQASNAWRSTKLWRRAGAMRQTRPA